MSSLNFSLLLLVIKENQFSTLYETFVGRKLVSVNRKQYVVDFRVVTPCNDVVGYQRFGEPCYIHLQGHNSADLDLYLHPR
jgi:hypothetical protein